jgi:hypothetical protein
VRLELVVALVHLGLSWVVRELIMVGSGMLDC